MTLANSTVSFFFFFIKPYAAITHNVIRTLLLCRYLLCGCDGGGDTMRISNRHSSSLIFLFCPCRKCAPGIRECFFFFTSGPRKVLNIPIYVDPPAFGTSETCPAKRYDFGVYILYGIARKTPFFCRPQPPVRLYNTRT